MSHGMDQMAKKRFKEPLAYSSNIPLDGTVDHGTML